MRRAVDAAKMCMFLGPVLMVASGCTDAGFEGIYEVPNELSALSGEAFFDHPVPSDFRRTDGFVDYRGFYNARDSAVLSQYLDTSVGIIDGFSSVAAGQLRFRGPLDPNSLPGSAVESLSAESSVQLIALDGPTAGSRHPIDVDFRAQGGVYTVSNTLRFRPALGFPLEHATRYALVVTEAITGTDGQQIHPAGDLVAALGLGPELPGDSSRVSAHRASISSAADILAQHGIDRQAIVHLAVFTVGDPTKDTRALAAHVHSQVEAPYLGDEFEVIPHNSAGYTEYRGTYGPSPNYQFGELPFKDHGDGGSFRFNNGQPQVANTYWQRFTLNVPNPDVCTEPAEGFPVVLYAHGTGGDYRSIVTSGYATDLAAVCMASMGVDQIFHGDRPGASDEPNSTSLLFFNFNNIEAARHNGQQSGIDEVQRARLFTETRVTIPAAVSITGADIHFNGNNLTYFGHSQGGLNGPIYLAVDDSARGGVLSGAGAVLALTLLEKTEPKPEIPGLVRSIFLKLSSEEGDELDYYHPAVWFAQTLVDPIDPISYARLMGGRDQRLPTPGKSILMTEGIDASGEGDHYTPTGGTEAQATAIGLPLLLPAVFPFDLTALGAPAGLTVPAEGVAGNLNGGTSSGALVQWAPPEGREGHFVSFSVEGARQHNVAFLRALADDPIGRVPSR